MQQGRRTASLKASYEAIHAGAPPGELQLGRELAGAAQQALQAAHHEPPPAAPYAPHPPTPTHVANTQPNKRHKK